MAIKDSQGPEANRGLHGGGERFGDQQRRAGGTPLERRARVGHRLKNEGSLSFRAAWGKHSSPLQLCFQCLALCLAQRRAKATAA